MGGWVGGYQQESSRLLLFCSEPQLHSRTMMLCKLGSTIPSRGLWEGSPFQQASISCQHSWSKQGSRSGLAPGHRRLSAGPRKRRASPKAESPLTFSDIVPELVLAGAFLKGFWEFDRAGAEVPEEDAESINVHRVVILPCQDGRLEKGWTPVCSVMN